MDTSFSITDFTSACILRASGIPLLRLDMGNNRIICFVFDSTPTNCEQILKQHWDRNLNLESRLLFEVISELKTRIHQLLSRKP